jgi:hypothetical protein
MKRILIIAILFISACHNIDPKQERAEGLAKVYINQHLKKYKGIRLSELYNLRTSYIHTNEGLRLNQKIMLERDSIRKLDSEESPLTKNIIKGAKFNSGKINSIREKKDLLSDTMIHNMAKLINLETAYKGVLKGYKLYYTYKIQDKLEPVYHKTTFIIDTPILHITSVKDTIIDEQDVSWK